MIWGVKNWVYVRTNEMLRILWQPNIVGSWRVVQKVPPTPSNDLNRSVSTLYKYTNSLNFLLPVPPLQDIRNTASHILSIYQLTNLLYSLSYFSSVFFFLFFRFLFLLCFISILIFLFFNFIYNFDLLKQAPIWLKMLLPPGLLVRCTVRWIGISRKK